MMVGTVLYCIRDVMAACVVTTSTTRSMRAYVVVWESQRLCHCILRGHGELCLGVVDGGIGFDGMDSFMYRDVLAA